MHGRAGSWALVGGLAWAWLALFGGGCLSILGADPDEFFETRIRPVLVERCGECHGAEAAGGRGKGGLRLDAKAAVLRGGDSGPAAVAGRPEASLLVRALTYDDPDLRMPPKTRLSAEVIEDFRVWVRDGLHWPGATGAGEGVTPRAVAASRAGQGFDLAGRKAAHWAWRPVECPPVPKVSQEGWPAGEVDRFILARLEAAGLSPAPPADRRVLIRRASLVLTGLPPSPEEVEAYLGDDSPRAFERVVDRLLASPHFGERWARHWLDKVRYAETMGHEFDYPIVGAWRYRDYVVRAFNGDVPYDRFVREQIAGDLLTDRRRNPADGTDESMLGAMHFWLLQQVHSPVDVRAQQAETTDNQIDVLGKAFLGMTVACARCHDHKFDAISTRDYYAWYGILSGSRFALRAVDDPTPRRAQRSRMGGVREALRVQLADALMAKWGAGNAAGAAVRLQGEVAPRPEDRVLGREGWFPDGDAFAEGLEAGGQAVWLGGRIARAGVVLPGWWHSAALGRRFQGALRSPTFTLDDDYLHLRLAGWGSRFSVVVEGFTLIQAPIYGALRQAVRSEEPHWVSVDVGMWKGRRAWLEFADLGEPDPASPMAPETRSPEGWISVGEVVVSSMKAPPPLVPVVEPVDGVELVARWRAQPRTLSLGEAAWLGDRLRKLEPAEALGAAWRELEAEITPPVLVAGMADGTGVDEPVFIRGSPRKPGEIVERRFLEALTPPAPASERFRVGSGRLALAEAIAHPDNPLFSRVPVNWVWSHLFGRGLVGSVDNFGVLGEAPTHPELVDWLADRFRSGGWSMKRLIRELVLSRTWQMSSSEAEPRAAEKDPDNRLWHRGALRRLEGEAIRDAMLAVSGRLDPAVGGPSVPMHLTPFLEGRGRPGLSGPLDGEGRRSLYLEVRRNFLSPFLLAFDFPVPSTTVGRRSVSNVPAQALAMMNDPFVAEQAGLWGRRVWEEGQGQGDMGRVEAMYLRALGRPPGDEERERALRFVKGRAAAGEDAAAAWVDLAQVLFNAKEFQFIP